MSFKWADPGSLTRHFSFANIPAEIAKLPMPATLAQAQAAMDAAGSQNLGLAERLFAVVDGHILEDEMVSSCRAGRGDALLLLWSAFLIGETRIADVVEKFLTTPDGKLDPTHYSSGPLLAYLAAETTASGELVFGSSGKSTSNLLRFMASVGLVDPATHGGTIVGIGSALPTGHAAAGLAQLVADRVGAKLVSPAPGSDPVDLALGVGANHWINLTAEEFRRAAHPPSAVVPASRASELPDHLKELRTELYRKGQVILQGPPGTGKTHLAREFIGWFSGPDSGASQVSRIAETLPSHERTPERVAEVAAASGLVGIWDIVQFHPSMSYDDFVRSLRAEPVAGGVTFVPTHRTFGFLCAVGAHLKTLGSTIEVLLIVDEINRADISKVLGELIYGLEYRDQPVTTPYTVDGSAAITVPSNLYLIGTMNTADRSIALIDYALRRRFVYLDVLPDRAAIESATGFTPAGRSAALVLFDRVAAIFAASSELRSIQPGHSYFLPNSGSADATAEADSIARRFAYELIPLLFEYETEGRFSSGTVTTLVTSLGLSTKVEPGSLNQKALVDELAASVLTGSIIPPVSLPAASPAPASETLEPLTDTGLADDSAE